MASAGSLPRQAAETPDAGRLRTVANSAQDQRVWRTAADCDSVTPKKRVVLISNRVMHYRVSVYNYFWRRFREADWDFSVLTNDVQGENRHQPLFELNVLPFGFGTYRRKVRELNPDAVILFLHMKDRILWPLVHWLKLSRRPVALWTKTRNFDDLHNALKNALFDYLHAISDALIVYTDDLQKFVSPRNRHKMFAANNTINFEEFPIVEETKAQVKELLGIPFEKVVLFAGRMGVGGERKKVDQLIELFRQLNRPDVGLVIVGSGLSDDLRARLNRLNTRYLGEVHDPENLQISRIFKAADVFCIPGHVGLGLNQAFFWGLPVVTAKGKQPPEITYLRDGENGFIVPEDDVTALEQRLLWLIDDDQLRCRLGSNAHRDILARASIEGMFQGFLCCAEYLHRAGRQRAAAGARA
jgi:glycosyltransferase involved in cell wall biosynthesis